MQLMIRPIMPYDIPKLTENPFVLISGFVLLITAVLIAVVLSRYAAEANKGDKKKVTVSYTDPFNSSFNYEDSATIDVQGTSSQWSKFWLPY